MQPEKEKPARKLARTTGELAPFLSWGWQFALTLGVLAWLGHWMDQKFETRVLYTLIGLFMGLFGGFYNLYRMISHMPSKHTKTGGR